MRILHVVGSFAVGGAEKLTMLLLDGLKRTGHEVAAVSLFDAQDSYLDEVLARREIPVYRLGKQRGFDPRVFPRLTRVLRQFQPDIVHSHGYVLAYTLGVATLENVQGQVHTIHNVAGADMPWWGRYVLSLGVLVGVAPVAVSTEVARTARGAYRTVSVTIPNGIPIASFLDARRNRQSWRNRNGFNANDPLIVSVARLTPQKNHSLLVRAFARLPRASGAQLVLAGDGPLKEELKHQADSLGILDRVRFLGVRDDVPDLLGACDVFALSSDVEGNPLAVMEAMAVGLPIVATAVGGLPELLTDREEGFVVPAGNVDMLSEALAHLIDCPERRGSMGHAAQSKALAAFDIAHTVRSYVRLYEKLISDVRGQWANTS